MTTNFSPYHTRHFPQIQTKNDLKIPVCYFRLSLETSAKFSSLLILSKIHSTAQQAAFRHPSCLASSVLHPPWSCNHPIPSLILILQSSCSFTHPDPAMCNHPDPSLIQFLHSSWSYNDTIILFLHPSCFFTHPVSSPILFLQSPCSFTHPVPAIILFL